MKYVSIAMLALAMSGPAAPQQSQKTVEYDEFCKLPAQAKKTVFFQTTAENRGRLVRTQMERWRDANQGRMNDAQKAALDEAIKLITSEK